MDDHNAGEASKAYRFRKVLKAGGKLKPLDLAWYVDFEARKKRAEEARRSGSTDVGASRSTKSRKLHVDLEEHAEAEAVGTGSAASEAAVAAVMIDAEGKRVDALTVNALKIYEKCVEGWERMGTTCRRVVRELQRSNVELMRSYRDQYIGAANLETQLRTLMAEKENGDGDPINALMAAVAARHFGIPAELLPGVAAAAAKAGMPAGKKNGHAKK